MVKPILFGILFLVSHNLFAQLIATGFVMDADEHPIAGAHIQELGSVNATYSELDGSFSLHFFGQGNVIQFSHSQFDTLRRKLKVGEDQKVFMNLKLHGNAYSLEGYSGYTDFSVKNPNKHFENMPYFFGESDVNKQLQMLPGVEHGTEVLGNLYVRGGDVDQNLFMYNGTPVYNYNHLFGITNIFHQTSIGNTSLYKGISPASEGGRLSSVINLESTKDSKYSGLDGELEISPLNMGLFIENIVKDKSYFTLALRRSWLDLLFPAETRQNDFNLNFHDVQLNFGFGVKNGDKIEVSLLQTRDLLMLANVYQADSVTLDPGRSRQELRWSNLVGSVKYKQRVNHKLSAVHSLHYSGYGVSQSLSDEVFTTSTANPYTEIDYTSGIKDIMAKSAWVLSNSNRNTIDFGLQANMRLFNVGQLQRLSRNIPNTPDEESTTGSSNDPSVEIAIYGEDHFQWSSTTRFDAGLRAVVYHYNGYTIPVFEPRLHMHYIIDDVSIFKLGYNRNNQFISQLNTGGTGDPNNIWVPSTENILPAKSDIISATYERRLNTIYSFNANTYFKQMQNLRQVDNISDAVNPENDWQQDVFLGEGRAFGLELMAQKDQGVFTGWVSYTLARSDRDFPDLFDEKFLFTFDRTHIAKLYINYNSGAYWNFGANFLIGSGRMFTVPIGKYYDINNQLQLEYNTLNNYRSPLYHRLDLTVTRIKDFGSYEQHWKFYLYNATGARNPIFINADFANGSFTNLSVNRQFIAFVPGISYSIKF